MDARTVPSYGGVAIAPPPRVPMTAAAFRRLGAEVARLGGQLYAADAAVRREAVGPQDEGASTPSAAAEYHVLGSRLDALKRLLEAAEVVKSDGRAVLGARATVRFDDGEVEAFELVSPCEVDASAGRISHESPLGAALLGRRAGDTVSLHAPGGPQLLTVVDVSAA